MPLCGDFDGTAAFVVPTRRRPLIFGLIFNIVLALVFFLGVIVSQGAAEVVVMGLLAALFGYMGLAAWRSLRSGASYYLTRHGLTVRDGGGTLGVPWNDVQGFTPVHVRKKLVGFNVRFVPGSLVAQGPARRWQGVNRHLGAEFLLAARTHVGGADRMGGLLAWCLVPDHRIAIGTESGREAFRELARNASQATKPTA